MSKFKRLISLVLIMACLFSALGADVVEPSDLDMTAEEETTETSDIISELTEETHETDADVEEENPSEESEQDVTILQYSGDSYEVKVSYGPETGIPSDCELIVSEIPEGDVYDEYLDLTSNALNNAEINKVRFFDICIMKDGIEMEPAEGTSVSVKITLNETFNNEVNVVHISDEAEASVIDTLNVTDAENGEGTEVTFSADGFSAYAIVEGPASVAIQTGWKRITSLTELEAHADEIYWGHVNGYYFKDTQYTISGSRTGISKTKPAQTEYPHEDAKAYVFEKCGENEYRIYCVVDGTNKYIRQIDNALSFVTSEGQATIFKVSKSTSVNNAFRFNGSGTYYINQNSSDKGDGFAAYQGAEDINAQLCLWYYDYQSESVDPYGLDGKSIGLIYYKNGASGAGLMASSTIPNHLDALSLPVLTEKDHHDDKLFVPNDSDLTMWTFTWCEDDRYYLSAELDGTTVYLNIDSSGNLSTSTTPQTITVIPGKQTGNDKTYVGKIALMANGRVVNYTGDLASGFDTNSYNADQSKPVTKWLNFVEPATLTDKYVLPYSARKISVSDESLKDGDRIIIYTRVWNEAKKQYDFYAIDHEGNLHPCFEEGDEIQWIDDRINTLLWDLTIYYNEGVENPTKADENRYYELYNEYSEKYIRPNAGNGEALGDSIIGINLLGRNENNYFTQIVAWDDDNYAYAGIKTDIANQKIVSYSVVDGITEDESIDFYFARVNDFSTEAVLHPVETVDHTQYGITMKIIDFGNTSNWKDGEQTKFLNSTADGSSGNNTYLYASPGILSNSLGSDGYPTVTSGPHAGESLANLYSADRLKEANHLFIDSTYYSSGYFVYDSSQNYASYNESTGEFTVYQELGTHDDKNSASVKHGQFFPFNTIDPTVISTKNPENLYTALLNPLDDSNPRKYENLYKINNPDYQFGVELEASFVQTPNGLDDWGHDIIYEFTGDDDFWLYVDGELVIDLGGVHSALLGSINYATGDIQVQNDSGKIRNLTLYEIFEEHYRNSGEHTDQEVQEYLDGIFQQKSNGKYVFKDYTSHTMRIFYMERGKGASNLNMRFNQSSVKPETVILSKELDGVEHPEKFNAEFPYQIFYSYSEDPDQAIYYSLTNTDANINVVYRGTDKKVKFEPDYTIDGVDYSNVFFLEPGEACEIKLPDGAIEYYVVECGVDPYVFSEVKANDVIVSGTPISGSDRENYAIGAAKAEERTSVKYVNKVNKDALRVLTFTKKLWDETGITGNHPLTDDPTVFNFRLYLATEHETNQEVALANMYTYHVKDPQGRYCRWDSATQKFVPLSDTATDYTALDTADKRKVSFTTSMYGSISKIPAFYTVEVRELLAGTKYEVEERPNEIPDGYSRIQYDIFTDVNDVTTKDICPYEKVSTIEKGKDPHVDVHNIKGYGIRMYKEWTDENFVSSRDNTYFAIYINGVLDPNTIYELKYKKGTLYWYYETLETGLSLLDYQVKEVEVTGAVVDSDGKVTSYTSIDPKDNNEEIRLNGILKGETDSTEFVYKVKYKSAQMPTANMRIETIENEREGIKIYKKYKNGNTLTPLAGAQFDIREKGSQVSLGTFISDDDGFVTFAYLRKNVEYTLTEIKSPAGYTGLKKSLTMVMGDDGKITVTADPSTVDKDNNRFTYVAGPDDPSITVFNFKYTFEIKKLDKATLEPVEGVEFELHKQKTVGGVTVVDFQAMAGYEHLFTDSNGIIPHINSTLPAGTYELREVDPGHTHQGLNYFVLFTVTQTGDIKLNQAHPEIKVVEENVIDPDSGEERVLYDLLIFNYPVDGDLMLSKEVAGNMGDKTEVFPMTVTLKTAADQPYVGTIHVQKNGGVIEDYTITSTANGVVRVELSHGDFIVFSALADGTKFSITEQTKGYQSQGYLDGDPVSSNGTVSGDIEHNSKVRFVNSKNALVPTGLKTSFKCSVTVLLLMAGGFAITLYVKRKSRPDEYDEE